MSGSGRQQTGSFVTRFISRKNMVDFFAAGLTFRSYRCSEASVGMLTEETPDNSVIIRAVTLKMPCWSLSSRNDLKQGCVRHSLPVSSN